MNWEDAVADAFEQLSPNIDTIYEEARLQTLMAWNRHHRFLAGAGGFATGIVPGVHLAGIALDAFHMMRRMGHVSYGVGAILGERHDIGNILEPEDLALVLGLLADDAAIERNIASGMAKELAARIATQANLRLIAKTMSREHAELSGRRLTRKTASRLGARFARRAAPRIFWPASAVIGAYSNQALIDELLDAATDFYGFKVEVARRLS
ncbi:MAG: hypothetical protein AAGA73_01110 [Pseudomonadota bacterium]